MPGLEYSEWELVGEEQRGFQSFGFGLAEDRAGAKDPPELLDSIRFTSHPSSDKRAASRIAPLL